MPQLDIASFSSQIFWLLLIFSFVFSICYSTIVPFFSRLLKGRAKLISGLLKNSDAFSDEVLFTRSTLNSFFSSYVFVPFSSRCSKEVNAVVSWCSPALSMQTQFKHSNRYIGILSSISFTRFFFS